MIECAILFYASQFKEQQVIIGDLEKVIDKAAMVYAVIHSAAPDKETPDWIISDFKAGVKFAMDYLKEQQVGAVWVDVNKREPDNYFYAPLRITKQNGDYYYDSGDLEDIRALLKDVLKVEWLDESQPILHSVLPSDEDKFVSMEEYNDAVNEIAQLQEQLKEAEEEIRDLQREK